MTNRGHLCEWLLPLSQSKERKESVCAAPVTA